MDKAYIEVVRLLLASTPAIFQTAHFAMKGGTAINLFVEDMPRLKPAFENEFSGITWKPISLGELQRVRSRLKKELPDALTANQRRFLVGLVEGEPNWKLRSCPHLATLPAIRWKLQNLAKLKKANPRKFAQQADELRVKLAC